MAGADDDDAMEVDDVTVAPPLPVKLRYQVKKSFNDHRAALHSSMEQAVVCAALADGHESVCTPVLFDAVCQVMEVKPEVRARIAVHIGWASAPAVVRLSHSLDAVMGRGLVLTWTARFQVPVVVYIIAEATRRWRDDGSNTPFQFRGSSCVHMDDDGRTLRVCHDFLAVCHLGVSMAACVDEWLQVAATTSPLFVVTGREANVWVEPAVWSPVGVDGCRRAMPGADIRRGLQCPQWARAHCTGMPEYGFFDSGGNQLQLVAIDDNDREYVCVRASDRTAAAYVVPHRSVRGRYLIMFNWTEVYWLNVAHGWRDPYGRDAFSVCAEITDETSDIERAGRSLQRVSHIGGLLRRLFRKLNVWPAGLAANDLPQLHLLAQSVHI